MLSSLRLVHVVSGIVAAAVVCAGAWLIDRTESSEHDAARRMQVQERLSSVRARLEMELNGRIHLASGLEALAVARPSLTQREFETFARVIRGDQGGIRSLQLARDGVVTHLFPEAGNEAARGHDILADPATEQAARVAMQTRGLALAGPYLLRQGGSGLVARLPIFVQGAGDTERFWGFAVVVIDYAPLIAASGIDDMAETEFAIRGRDGYGAAGDVFFGAPDLFDAERLEVEVRFPNGKWVLAARPRSGWDVDWPGRSWLIAVGLLLLAAIPFIVGAFARATRQRDEAARLAQRDRLLGSLGEGVYGVDGAGHCMFVNDSALRMLGYARDQVVGAEPDALFLGPVRREADASPGSFETALRRRDGTRFPAVATVAPVQDGHGVVVAFNDITQRKQAEERLRLAASVFARTQQGIMITNAHGALLDVNPAFTEITGYAREEVLGKSPRLLSSGRQDAAFYARMKTALAQTGLWRGEIWNRHKSGRAYPELLSIAAVEDAAGGVSHYIGVFSDISRQKQHEAELARIAHYDALTALPNRALLTDRLAQALDQTRGAGTRMGVCMLDLDGFKHVNDRHGHDAGDEVLTEIAMRLKAAVRSGDTVARLGGDEFVLLLVNVEGRAQCEAHVQRILRAVAAPMPLGRSEVVTTASLGLTLFPDDASDADTLLRHADQAMYAAKQEGRNRHRLFDPEQDRQARTHRDSLQRIAAAIEDGELRLHYHPKVDMRAGRVVGFEALARWQHPTEGLLGPADFLPTIDGTELDVELGRWVLDHAVRQLAQWRSSGLPFALSVNVSGRHLLAPGFAQELASLLARHPILERGALEIEILETAAIMDLDAASQVLRECLRLGVGVALDDFGTGYSSLAYFRRLPVKTLKIDQLFIRDMLEDADDMAIVEGVIRFAKAFDRGIVAEGVHAHELGVLLLAMGCDIVQGHAISPPMPAERVPEWFRAFRPHAEWGLSTIACSGDLHRLAAELRARRDAGVAPAHGRKLKAVV